MNLGEIDFRGESRSVTNRSTRPIPGFLGSDLWKFRMQTTAGSGGHDLSGTGTRDLRLGHIVSRIGRVES